MRIETQQKDDGRWIAEVPELPGVMTYGLTREDAIERIEALVLRVVVDRLDGGESVPELDELLSEWI
jgi:predicted RNase H-like HicB family nuclease